MDVKPVPGHEGGQAVGQRKLYCVYGNGPSSYSQTTGDVIRLGPGIYIDDVLDNLRLSVSGNYFVVPQADAGGTTRANWHWHWFTGGTAFTEVNNGVDLSAEVVQFTVLGGEF